MSQTNTTNKSDRELGNNFDLNQFNKKFSDSDKLIEQEKLISSSNEMKIPDEIIGTKLPHKKPVEDIIVNIRDLFYKIIELGIDRKNPIPFIFSSPDRHFAFAILLIITGTLLMLFSNLMQSVPDEK